jgi:hypothetical protein
MNCGREGVPVGKSAKVEPKGTQPGNGVKSYPDKHAAERHQHQAEPVKAKIIKTDD